MTTGTNHRSQPLTGPHAHGSDIKGDIGDWLAGPAYSDKSKAGDSKAEQS